MKKILSILVLLTLCGIFNFCSAQDIWIGEDSKGNYWAMSETLEVFIDEDGCEADYCDIDFKIVSSNKKYKIYHCRIWSSGSYKINNENMQEPKKYPHVMYKLYKFTLDRIRNGDFIYRH